MKRLLPKIAGTLRRAVGNGAGTPGVWRSNPSNRNQADGTAERACYVARRNREQSVPARHSTDGSTTGAPACDFR